MLRNAKWTLFALLILAMVSKSVQAQAKPYSLHDITELLKGGVPSARILDLAQKSCITFELTPDMSEVVKSAGGDAVLIAALRSVCRRNPVMKGEVDSPRPKPKVVSKVVKPPVISPVKEPPVPASSGTLKYYRYELQTMSGDARYAGELNEKPANMPYFYAVQFDPSGRVRHVNRYSHGESALASEWIYKTNGSVPDSLVENAGNDYLDRYHTLLRDNAGNVVRKITFDSRGKPSGTTTRKVQADRVETFDSTADGEETARGVEYYARNGLIARLDFSSREMLGGSTEFANGLASVTRYKRVNGDVIEMRYEYDMNRARTKTQFYRNGQLITTFVYVPRVPTSYYYSLTHALGPDGQLMAEYPNLDVSVTEVDSSGQPMVNGKLVPRSMVSSRRWTIHKKTPWW